MTKHNSALANIPALVKTAKALKPKPGTVKDCFGARVESTAATFPDNTAITFEGRSLNWRDFNALANR